MKRVKELVSTDAPDLWKTFKDGVRKACERKKSRRGRGDVWWWNEEFKETIATYKVAFKELCRFSSDENKTQHKRLRNQKKNCC